MFMWRRCTDMCGGIVGSFAFPSSASIYWSRVDFVEACENSLCLIFQKLAVPDNSCTTRMCPCLNIINGWPLSLPPPSPQAKRSFGGSCCNTRHHGRLWGPALTAGALNETYRKSLIVREEKEKVSVY